MQHNPVRPRERQAEMIDIQHMANDPAKLCDELRHRQLLGNVYHQLAGSTVLQGDREQSTCSIQQKLVPGSSASSIWFHSSHIESGQHSVRNNSRASHLLNVAPQPCLVTSIPLHTQPQNPASSQVRNNNSKPTCRRSLKNSRASHLLNVAPQLCLIKLATLHAQPHSIQSAVR
jgi:hypothetical protein